MRILRPQILFVLVAIVLGTVQATVDVADSSAARREYVVMLRQEVAKAATIERLEKELDVHVSGAVTSHSFAGFAVKLSKKQAARLAADTAVAAIASARSTWVVVYDDRWWPDVSDLRTQALERSLGFRAGARYHDLEQGFDAELSPKQLERLAKQPDIRRIEPRAWYPR
jgi:hypothetical protein